MSSRYCFAGSAAPPRAALPSTRIIPERLWRAALPAFRGLPAMKFTPEHEALRQTWKTLIDREINPHVDEWEKEGAFPAHALFKKMGNAGLLGVDKPVEFGDLGLDFSYAMVCANRSAWLKIHLAVDIKKRILSLIVTSEQCT